MTIRVSNRIQDLTGKGIEYLTDSDGIYIIAKFEDGKMNPKEIRIEGNLEVTVLAA